MHHAPSSQIQSRTASDCVRVAHASASSDRSEIDELSDSRISTRNSWIGMAIAIGSNELGAERIVHVSRTDDLHMESTPISMDSNLELLLAYLLQTCNHNLIRSRVVILTSAARI
jgi:hypothetical protein